MAPKKMMDFCQEDFFYDVQWGRTIDNAFIDFLAIEATTGNFVWPKKTADSLMAARDRICMQFNEKFTFYYCLTRMDVLEQRFLTFKKMLSLDGVKYDPSANVVIAPDNVWRDMLADNMFVNAYITNGEPKFEELSLIFAPSVPELVIVSGDEELEGVKHDGNGNVKAHRGKVRMQFKDDVLPNMMSPLGGCVELALNRGKGKCLDGGNASNNFHMDVGVKRNNVGPAPIKARPPRPSTNHPSYAYPIECQPKTTSLDLIYLSDNSIETPPFNIWDYIEYFSDTDSSATDISTANSYNYGARGQRSQLDRKNESSRNGSRRRFSSTDSCSPLPKEKK